VAEERSYSVTVFGFSFDSFTDSDAIWQHFVIAGRDAIWRNFDIAGRGAIWRNFDIAGRGAIWRHFDRAERLNFNNLIMLKFLFLCYGQQALYMRDYRLSRRYDVYRFWDVKPCSLVAID